MPGAREFAEVESRIQRMTDAELVEMVELHPDDYEPWALDIGRAELARRKVPRELVRQLAAENVADAAARQPPSVGESMLDHLMLPVAVIIGLIAFPAYFILARTLERHGDVRLAQSLRMIAGFIAAGYVAFAIAGLLWLLGIVKS